MRTSLKTRGRQPCPICNNGNRITTKGRPRVKQTVGYRGFGHETFGSEKPIRLYKLEHKPSKSSYPWRPSFFGYPSAQYTRWVCPACKARRTKQKPPEPEVLEWMKPKPGREERQKAKARKHKMRQSKEQK